VGEPRTGVRGCGLSVARAFQPEICPFRLERLEIGVTGRVGLQRFGSREAANPRSREGRRKGWWLVVRELCWWSLPPHPRPLSPGGGEGGCC